MSSPNKEQEVKKMPEKTERLTMTIEEAGEALGISRATAYTLAQQGRLPVIKISDRRWIVPRKALDQMLDSVNNK